MSPEELATWLDERAMREQVPAHVRLVAQLQGIVFRLDAAQTKYRRALERVRADRVRNECELGREVAEIADAALAESDKVGAPLAADEAREAVIRMVIEMAKNGNVGALRKALEIVQEEATRRPVIAGQKGRKGADNE